MPDIGLFDTYSLFDQSYDDGGGDTTIITDQPYGDAKPWITSGENKDLRVKVGISGKVIDNYQKPLAHNTRELVRPASQLIIMGEMAVLFGGAELKDFTIGLIDAFGSPVCEIQIHVGAAQYFSGRASVSFNFDDTHTGTYDANYIFPGNTWQQFTIAYTQAADSPPALTFLSGNHRLYMLAPGAVGGGPIKTIKLSMVGGTPLYSSWQLQALSYRIPVEVPEPEE